MVSLNFMLKSWFLQVRENCEKSGNLCGQGKVRGKYYFWKVREKITENDLWSCGLQISVIFLHL